MMKQKLFTLFVALVATTALWAQNNVITYTAAEKLTETTELWNSGLHINAFNVAISSHSFSNGIGTITFKSEVTTIGDWAFVFCSGLTSITIPNSIIEIGNYAFSGCSGLTLITIPNSVTTIGSYAFSDCSGLTSVTIPNSVTTIGNNAFSNCSGLTSPVYNANYFVYMPTSYMGAYTIPDGIKQIIGGAFSNCTGLTSITIPNSVTTIGSSAFSNCRGLTSVTIPNSVTTIGNNAFSNCSGLPSPVYNANCFAYMPTSYMGAYTIPDGIKQIIGGAFHNCSKLTSVTIPNSVTTIGSNAFSNCSKLTSVTIPNSVTTIGSNAFYNCSGLTSVTIGNSVTSIGYSAFYNCSGLNSITIPNSVTTIGEEAFGGVNNIVYNGTATGSPWGAKYVNKYVEGYLVYSDETKTTLCGCSSAATGEIIIPNSVTTIGDSAFYYCSGLTSVTIPNSVTTIGSSAFQYCSDLTSVTIPNSVTRIEDRVFVGCYGLKSITIPNSVTTIGDFAFYNCSGLTSVTIPNSVTTIEDYAFDGCSGLTSVTIPNSVTTIGSSAFEGCSGLTSVTCKATTPPACGYNCFRGVETYYIPLCVPIGYVEVYKAADVWKGFRNIQDGTFITYTAKGKLTGSTLDVGETTFGPAIISHTFLDGTGTITCSGEITTIGEEAFQYCSDLTSVTIPNTVTTIGWYAFQYCRGLKSVTIPNSVTEIGWYAFCECSNLTSVTLGNSVTTIGEAAFRLCSSLTSITIPNSVTIIGEEAFRACSNLTSITIGNSVTTISGRAFWGCEGLTKTNYVGTIADWCKIKFNNDYANPIYYSHNLFINNVQIKNLVIPIDVESIGWYAFYDCSSLTSVSIPNSVTEIGGWAFHGCTSLTKTNFIGTIADWCKIKFDHGSSNPIECSHNLFINDVEEKDIVIPEGVDKIENYAFCGCSGLTSISIPNSIVEIGNYAFAGCENMKSVYVMFNNPFEADYSDAITKYFDPSILSNKIQGVEAYDISPTCATVKVDLTNVDVSRYSKMCLNYNEQEYALQAGVNTILLTGLHPNKENNLGFFSQLPSTTNWIEGVTIEVTTPELTLTTLNPKVVSAGTAVVAAETNISDYETNVGFEWRKYDAPSTMPSKSGAAVVCNGMMEGRLLNLGTDSYWNVRPYYEAADGTRYYGEWITFDPSDFSYFEPTVHTYALATSPTSNSVQVRGYVMTGTDEVTEQGFEYWVNSAEAPNRVSSATSEDVHRVKASGQLMTAVLENLAYSSTYTCRAYALAGGKTYYGEEVQFLTPENPTGLFDVLMNNDAPQATKFMHNGQLFILRDGNLYTATGAKVK